MDILDHVGPLKYSFGDTALGDRQQIPASGIEPGAVFAHRSYGRLDWQDWDQQVQTLTSSSGPSYRAYSVS